MSVELTPTDDCWVNDFPENRDRNLDRKGLGIGRWEALNRSYLKFDLSKVPFAGEALKYAELRLYGKALFTPCLARVVQVSPAWNEETVTWNTQPSIYRSDGRYIMGETTEIPVEESWFSIPIDTFFVKRRWGRMLSMRIQGYEGAEDSYFYAYDKEEAGGTYAPRLFLSVAPPAPPKPPPPKPPWTGLASLAMGVGLLLVKPPRLASP